MFEFIPEDKSKLHIAHFKKISESNKEGPKGTMLGIIYESYSTLTQEGKPKLMIQNEVNEVELNLPVDFKPQSLLISGCVYVVKGNEEGKDLTFTVKSIELPLQGSEAKQSPLKMKFRQMCENISSGKESLGFTVADFAKYDCVYTQANEQPKPTLIYGNVTINTKTLGRLSRLVAAYPQGVAAVILLLSEE